MTQIGNIYGESLYTLAAEEGLSQAILSELLVLKEAFAAEPDYLRLLSAPNLPKEERCRIIDDAFAGKIQPYLLNFLKILTEKGYVRHFGDCCEAYRACYNRDNGILVVTAISAIPLSAAQCEKLTGKLAGITGKRIDLVCKVDPTCYGGIRLEYDGKSIDGTVAHRLDSMRKLLKNTVL